MTTQTQEELRKQALLKILIDESAKIIKEDFFGKIIFEVRNGAVYQIRTEQTKDIAEAVSKMQKQGG